jgi:D-amino peptidase
MAGSSDPYGILTSILYEEAKMAIEETRPTKIYMLCDMEGVSGLYTREHAWYWEKGAREHVCAEGRRLLTADINSAASAVLAAGVEHLVICDTHHGGGNILWSEMLTDPRIVYETPRPQMMPSLDNTFDGLILLGHHAKAGTQNAFLDHSWALTIFDFQINGMSVGEVGIETCYAGHWDVPLIMVQGDAACCAEAEIQFPGVVTAAVKQGTCFNSACGPAAEVGREITAAKVAEAVRKAQTKELAPFKPSLPITIHVITTTTEAADRIARRPGVRRLDGRTVETEIAQQCDVLNWTAGY